MRAMIGGRSSQIITFCDSDVGQIEQDVNIPEFISFMTVKKQGNKMEDKTFFRRGLILSYKYCGQETRKIAKLFAFRNNIYVS